jgi:hypothetical protein
MAADTVQRKDERLGRVARLDAAGPNSAGVDEVLFEGNALQIGPDAGKVLWSSVAHNWISFVDVRRKAACRWVSTERMVSAAGPLRGPEDPGPSGWLH